MSHPGDSQSPLPLGPPRHYRPSGRPTVSPSTPPNSRLPNSQWQPSSPRMSPNATAPDESHSSSVVGPSPSSPPDLQNGSPHDLRCRATQAVQAASVSSRPTVAPLSASVRKPAPGHSVSGLHSNCSTPRKSPPFLATTSHGAHIGGSSTSSNMGPRLARKDVSAIHPSTRSLPPCPMLASGSAYLPRAAQGDVMAIPNAIVSPRGCRRSSPPCELSCEPSRRGPEGSSRRVMPPVATCKSCRALRNFSQTKSRITSPSSSHAGYYHQGSEMCLRAAPSSLLGISSPVVREATGIGHGSEFAEWHEGFVPEQPSGDWKVLDSRAKASVVPFPKPQGDSTPCQPSAGALISSALPSRSSTVPAETAAVTPVPACVSAFITAEGLPCPHSPPCPKDATAAAARMSQLALHQFLTRLLPGYVICDHLESIAYESQLVKETRAKEEGRRRLIGGQKTTYKNGSSGKMVLTPPQCTENWWSQNYADRDHYQSATQAHFPPTPPSKFGDFMDWSLYNSERFYSSVNNRGHNSRGGSQKTGLDPEGYRFQLAHDAVYLARWLKVDPASSMPRLAQPCRQRQKSGVNGQKRRRGTEISILLRRRDLVTAAAKNGTADGRGTAEPAASSTQQQGSQSNTGREPSAGSAESAESRLTSDPPSSIVALHPVGGSPQILCHASAFVSNVTYVFGGLTLHGCSNRLWSLNPAEGGWRLVQSQCQSDGDALQPSPRYNHTLVAWKDQLVLFGGDGLPGYMDDLWYFDTQTLLWDRISLEQEQERSRPGARCGHSAVVRGDEMLIFGGWRGAEPFCDAWSCDLRAREWTVLSRHCGGRQNELLVTAREGFLIAEGDSPSTEYPPVSASPPHTVLASNPVRRPFGTADCLTVSPSMKTIGAQRGGTTKAPAKKIAQKCVSRGGGYRELPLPRHWHQAAVHGEWMYIYGGYGISGTLAEMWRFHLEQRIWEHVETRGAKPAKRCRHTSVVWDSHWVIVGGKDSLGSYFSDVHLFDFRTHCWTQVLPISPPWPLDLNVTPWWSSGSVIRQLPSLHCHSMAFDPKRGILVITGGCDGASRALDSTILVRRFPVATVLFDDWAAKIPRQLSLEGALSSSSSMSTRKKKDCEDGGSIEKSVAFREGLGATSSSTVGAILPAFIHYHPHPYSDEILKFL